jgi:hypothetical protein
MKRIMFAGALLRAMAPQVHADDAIRAEEHGSNADLRGAYSFMPPGHLARKCLPLRARPRTNGRGKAEGVIQISLNGVLTPLLDWSGT